MLSDEEKKFKASHFENIDELIKTCEMWIQDDDWEAYCRFFDMGAMEELINLIEKQSKEIEELNYIKRSFDYCVEQENKKWEDKIKAKIEYCREILYSFEKELELKANKDKFIHKESMNCLLGQISILQSLLEKE